MDINSILNLLSNTKAVVAQHEKESKARGEDFNIFSVLGMESNETKTHSGMLVALLDPNGNHYQGTTFLELFLKEIEYDFAGENLDLVKVQSEYHLGTITQDYLSGGFIDILISFPSGKAIAIENKIYAGDQPKQMYRYSHYKKGLCDLYYLNLYGNRPSEDSLYKLTDKDYKIITYCNQIVEWLEKCIQAVIQGSIVETSIRQYYILIKQITNTMDNQLEQELNSIIFQNLEEAKYIHSNYQKAVESVKEQFRLAVFEELKNNLGDKLTVRKGNDVSFAYSQLWIDGKDGDKHLQFGIESFSGSGNNHGRLFVGIIDKGSKILSKAEDDFRLNQYWPVVRQIKTKKGNPLNLSSNSILMQLRNDSSYFNDLVIHTTQQALSFIELYQENFNKK